MPQQAPITAQIMHYASPVGGWNSLDSYVQMDPADAVRLDNLFPDVSYVRLRRGNQIFCTLPGAPSIKSLMTYSSATTQQLLAAGGGSIYNVSTGTPTVVSGGTGFSSDVWQYTMMSTPGGQFLVAVNGTADQWIYDGTTWASSSNTWHPGTPVSSDVAMVTLYAQRLFFAAENSTLIMYLPVNVYQGEISSFDAGAFLRLGGGIACLGTWTRDDATQGSQNMLVIVSTLGEVLVYQGIDPSDATNWHLVGRFEIGKPVSGHRQLTRLGPDAMLICEDGFQALANYLALGESKALTSAISRKIGNAVSQAVKAGKDLFGWEALLYPANNAMIVNVPVAGGPAQQYVVNTISGSWCRFTGIPAQCWALFGSQPYWGDAAGNVWRGDTGSDDNGTPISFDMVTSFQLPGGSAAKKRALMARPFIMLGGGAYTPAMDVNVDYAITSVSSPITGAAGDTDWNNFNWDQANWGGDAVASPQWYSVAGLGTAFAIRINGMANAETFQLLALDLTYEPAVGVL